MSTTNKRWLLGILIVGAAIRLIASYVQPAYVDEAYNQYLCAAGPGAVLDVMRFDTHTPCLQLLAYPLFWFTDSIFVLRLPAICFGLASLFLNYHIFRSFFEERWALWLTAFTALSYHIFMNDAEFRPYSPLTFCMTAMWAALLDIKNDRVPFAFLGAERLRLRWFAFAFICLGCGCLHYLGTMEVFAGSLWLLLFTKSAHRGRLAFYSAFCCVPSCIWLVWTRLAPHPALVKSSEIFSAENINHFINYVGIAYFAAPLYLLGWNVSDFVNLGRGQLWSEMIAPWASFVSIVVNAMLWYCVAKGYKCLAATRGEEAKLMAIALLFPPVLLCVAGLGNLISWGLTLYMVPMTVPYLVLLFSYLQDKVKYGLVLAMTVSAAAVCCLVPFWSETWNCDWDGAIAAIEDASRSEDIILLYPAYSGYSFAKAYNPQGIDFVFERGRGLQCRQHRVPGKLAVVGLESWMFNQQFADKVFKGRRLFLIVSQFYNLTAANLEWHWLLQNYEAKKIYHHNSLIGWGFADVFLLEEK